MVHQGMPRSVATIPATGTVKSAITRSGRGAVEDRISEPRWQTPLVQPFDLPGGIADEEKGYFAAVDFERDAELRGRVPGQIDAQDARVAEQVVGALERLPVAVQGDRRSGFGGHQAGFEVRWQQLT